MNVFRRAQTLSCHRNTHTQPIDGPWDTAVSCVPRLATRKSRRKGNFAPPRRALIDFREHGRTTRAHSQPPATEPGRRWCNADPGFATQRRCLEGQETPVQKALGVHSLISESTAGPQHEHTHNSQRRSPVGGGAMPIQASLREGASRPRNTNNKSSRRALIDFGEHGRTTRAHSQRPATEPGRRWCNADPGFATRRRCLQGQETPTTKALGVPS